MILVPQQARCSPWLLRMAPLPIVLFFLWAGFVGLDRLGFYGDETIFINAALGGVDGDFINGRVFGIPTYIMPISGRSSLGSTLRSSGP